MPISQHRPTFIPLPSVEPQLVLRRDLAAALLTGQLAGLAMAVALVLVFTLILGRPWYLPVQVIGSFVTGASAVQGSFVASAFLAGLALHQAAAFGWSLAFGFSMSRLEPSWGTSLLTGLTLGAFSQLLDAQLLVPIAMRALHGRDLWTENVPVGWSWGAHLVFGATFVLFTPVWRLLSEDSRRRMGW